MQELGLPVVLRGENLLANAMTGQGKSLLYILPMLNRISRDPFGVFGLVIVPTRELAIMIREQTVFYGRDINLRVVVITGGQDFVEQSKNID